MEGEDSCLTTGTTKVQHTITARHSKKGKGHEDQN